MRSGLRQLRAGLHSLPQQSPFNHRRREFARIDFENQVVGILEREPPLAIAADEIRNPFDLHVVGHRPFLRIHPERPRLGE